MELTFWSTEDGQCDWCGEDLPWGHRWVSNNVGIFCCEACARAGRKEADASPK